MEEFNSSTGTNTEQNQQREKSNKKPIYKKWWFWVIIGVLVIAAFSSTQNNNGEKVGEYDSPQTQTQSSDNEGANSDTFKVGDIIAISDFELTVKTIEHNYDPTTVIFEPKSGKEYVKVTVLLDNKSTENQSYNTLDFALKDGDSVTHTTIEAPFAQADDSLSAGTVNTGSKIGGSMVFEIPQDSAPLVLTFRPSFWGNRQVEVNL
jgi:hypothetical protein